MSEPFALKHTHTHRHTINKKKSNRSNFMIPHQTFAMNTSLEPMKSLNSPSLPFHEKKYSNKTLPTLTAIADIDNYVHNGHADAIIEPISSSNEDMGSLQFSSKINGLNNHKYLIIQINIIRINNYGTFVDIQALEEALTRLADWAIQEDVKLAYKKFNRDILGRYKWNRYAMVFSDRLKYCRHVLVLKSKDDFEGDQQFLEYPRLYHTSQADCLRKNNPQRTFAEIKSEGSTEQLLMETKSAFCDLLRKKMKKNCLKMKSTFRSVLTCMRDTAQKCFGERKSRNKEIRVTKETPVQNEELNKLDYSDTEGNGSIWFGKKERRESENKPSWYSRNSERESGDENIWNNTAQIETGSTYPVKGWSASANVDQQTKNGKKTDSHQGGGTEMEEVVNNKLGGSGGCVKPGSICKGVRSPRRWKLNLENCKREKEEY